MKKIVRTISVLLTSLALSAVCGAREFEDQFGRTIEAELVSHTDADGDTITINRGGKEFEVKMTIFAAKDQEFIRKWMKSNRPKIAYAFRIDATKKKLSSESTSSYGRTSKVQEYAYEIKVTNLSRQPVKDITIEYHAYMSNKGYSYYTSSGYRYRDMSHQSDKVKVGGPLRYNQTATVETKPFKLDTVRSRYYYSSSTMKDSLLGVLARVSDPDGNVVGEYRSASTKFKHTWPSKGGKGGPSVTIK